MVTGFVELLHLHDSQTEGIANPESSCGIDMLASIAADLDLEPISRSEVVDGSTSDPIWGDAQAADVPKSGHGETNPSPWQSSGGWKRRDAAGSCLRLIPGLFFIHFLSVLIPCFGLDKCGAS
ncbi:hypothetical protein VPH35_039706 [Triticum aestivum]